MKLIITRHGETEENVKRISQGHLPGKLTEVGKEQAKRLAERLKDEKIDVIFSSDLARASDTAKEIVRFHSEIPIYFIEELRERFQGKMQGKNKNEIEGWGESIEMMDKMMAEAGAESIEELVQRAGKFLQMLLENFEGKNVLIVGHGGINHAFISNLLNQSFIKTWDKYKSGNTSVTIFEFNDDKKPELKLMNCVKHLEEE